jgi:hypothetical protein
MREKNILKIEKRKKYFNFYSQKNKNVHTTKNKKKKDEKKYYIK